MLVVTTTGYLVSMLGSYLADSKSSDAKILNKIIKTNAELIKVSTKDGDTFVVDGYPGFV